MIIHTKTFTDNDSFVKWQEENEGAQIIQVIPLNTQIEMDVDPTRCDGNIGHVLFVTYSVQQLYSKDAMEIRTLKNLIFRMTHHEGALEETKEQWLKVINEQLES